jgi:hypothetical protein
MTATWILAGKQFLLLTHIAATESVLLFVRIKSCLRLLSSNQRSALAANCLDRLARFFPNSTVAKQIIDSVISAAKRRRN